MSLFYQRLEEKDLIIYTISMKKVGLMTLLIWLLLIFLYYLLPTALRHVPAFLVALIIIIIFYPFARDVQRAKNKKVVKKPGGLREFRLDKNS